MTQNRICKTVSHHFVTGITRPHIYNLRTYSFLKGSGGTEVHDNKIQYIYKGIAKRSFEQKFRLEQYVDVKDAKLSNGLLTISLVREIPEERKPRQITLKSA